MELIADVGNAQIKGKSGNAETYFQHAIVELRHDEWESAMLRSQEQHPDLICINGVPCAIGSRAEYYGIPQRLTGASRYKDNYYGLFIAALLARMFERSLDDVFVFGSYAPGDWKYRDDLINAALGEWEVIYQKQEMTFNIVEAAVYEEPLGGLMNAMLKDDGQVNPHSSVKASDVSLVIDVGGHTTDVLRVEPDGKVDELSARSIQLGILKALRSFEENFRANHAELLKGTNDIDQDVVREALRTGKFNLRGLAGYVECQQEADFACNKLVNDVAKIFHDDFGGAARFDTVILTGGGSALLEDRLHVALDHNNIVLAEKRGRLHMANVRGGQKLFNLYRDAGVYHA